MKSTYKFTPKQLLAKKESIMSDLKDVWYQTPDLTLCELIWKATKDRPPLNLDDSEVLKMCQDYLIEYKAINSLKNKIKKGLKSCVTKLTLW